MDDAEHERRLRESRDAKARAVETLERLREQQRQATLDPPPPRDADAPDALLKWIAGMPQPTDDSHELRGSIERLELDLADLRAELASARAEAAQNLRTTAKQICDEVGKITGRDAQRIDKLTKRIDAVTSGKPRVVA
jgi:hypothetical protein